MKILCVVPHLEAGGAERQMTSIVNWLIKDSFSVKLCLFKKTGALLDGIPAEVEIFDLGKKTRWSAGMLIRKLSNLIASEKPDLIYSRVRYANCLVHHALALAGLRETRHVINEETILAQNLSEFRIGPFLKLWAKAVYKRVDHIVAPCELSKKDLLAHFGIPESHISVIYNAIDLGALQGIERTVPVSRFNGNGGPKIISVGSLRTVKGHKFLLRALKDILKRYPNCQLQILGEGSERAALERHAHELGIASHVRLPGICSPYQLVADSDVFVMPSLREGIPAALLEAMALRVPVVASRAGGMPEIVEDGVNGYLVEPGNWREISERVLELLGNREKRALFAEKGSKTVRERFDVSRTVRELERVFVRILGKDE